MGCLNTMSYWWLWPQCRKANRSFFLICPKGCYCGYGVGFFHFKILEENMYTYSIQNPKVIQLQYEKQEQSMYVYINEGIFPIQSILRRCFCSRRLDLDLMILEVFPNVMIPWQRILKLIPSRNSKTSGVFTLSISEVQRRGGGWCAALHYGSRPSHPPCIFTHKVVLQAQCKLIPLRPWGTCSPSPSSQHHGQCHHTEAVPFWQHTQHSFQPGLCEERWHMSIWVTSHPKC